MNEQSALAYLRELGLTVNISEHVASGIKGRLLVVHGKVLQGHYDSDSTRITFDHFYAAYHAIAEGLATPSVQDDVLEDVIPAMVENFLLQQNWRRMGDLDQLKRILRGPIAEWKGKRLLMSAPSSDDSPSLSPPAQQPEETAPSIPVYESIGAQIRRLRTESRWTIEDLAGATKIG